MNFRDRQREEALQGCHTSDARLADEPDPQRRARPSPCLPGTAEKVAEMEARKRAGLPLTDRKRDASLEDTERGIAVKRDKSGNLWNGGEKKLVGKVFPTSGFPAELRKNRLRKNLSARKLAALAGITGRSIRYLEAGHCVPTMRTVEKLARALGVEVGVLLGIREPLCEDWRPTAREWRNRQTEKTADR